MKQAQNARQQRGRSSSRQGGKSNRGSGNHRNEQQIRGNPKQLVEKYKNQARECLQAGDRMQAEYFFQFAEHYHRVLNENRNNNSNQGDRDNQQQNNRRKRAQGDNNSGSDDQQGDHQQRRGRRGRHRDDQQKPSSGEQQAGAGQTNGVDSKGGEASTEAGSGDSARTNNVKPAGQDDQVTDQASNGKTPAQDVPIEKTAEAAQGDDAVAVADLSDAPPKPARRRAPRKTAVPVEEKIAAVPLDPAASDLT